ncbi:MAG: RNase adapter RapZ [Deltaproteobacteria bacterium]|nr:MAG: RNase adapter RapZ [Deltaproteobacteria bacterium]TMA82551.1 MAG: RNase adapter RapZ [Deltaproteobacteria bacterium]TMB15807.1 MAG: RNase adapter RapZ [Deltaproteobacteria bacterium]
MTESLRLVVVTGLSGSGKSTAIHVLEDLGFYCIDNLPIALIPRLVELWETSRDEVRRVALGIDVRARHFLAEFPRVFDELRAQEVALEVLYLEASDDVLVRRFSETRRPHPADQGGGIADGIRREREKLHGLRELADRILDTSAFTVHEFRSALRDLVDRPEPGTMTIGLLSFGYKYGLPTDADLVLDCRFLPNPFFVEGLRDKTGSDPAVADYVLGRDETQEFVKRLVDLLAFTLPRYRREGKSYLTIALGCTGGRHRSIVLVEELRRRLQEGGHRVLVRHRDAER